MILHRLRGGTARAAGLLLTALSLAGFLAGSLAGPAAAETGAAASSQSSDQVETAALSPDEVALVNKAERYLNELDSMRARFVQVSSDGAFAEGRVLVKRPGRMRFEYDPPVPILMIADGVTLLYYDRELEQASFLPLWETPLWFLLGEEVAFDGDIEILRVEQDTGTLTIALRDGDRPDVGTVTLIFATKPLELRKWIVRDAQDVTTQVSLIDPTYDVAIDSEAFSYDDLEFDRAARPSQR